jgi:glycosyltransferase involved in cell wall biosynthesis
MSNNKTFAEQLKTNFAPGPYYEADAEKEPAPAEPAVRLIAFYLPQFHPCPENNLSWGKGFTEWTNVTKAIPQFPGHYQPQLPGELGFYDLRLPETLHQQAILARKYGIHGFCFHHYWFGGRRLLETPLNLLLKHTDIDLPFCICWANENWTRRWDGEENDILVAQHHSPEDDIEFAKSLIPIVTDPRYIRIKGRVVVILYRPSLFPDAMASVRRIRSCFIQSGLGNPYLIMAQSFHDEDPRIYGFDAAVEFPPHKLSVEMHNLNPQINFFNSNYQGLVYDYWEMVRRAAVVHSIPYRLFHTVCPGWDNEARKPGKGSTYAFSTPTKYEHWLSIACQEAIKEAEVSEKIVFINAWNEWAEGAHLEPDRHFGYAYLQTTARVLKKLESQAMSAFKPRIVVVSHDALYYGAQLLILNVVKTLVREFNVEVRVLLGKSGQLEKEFRSIAPTKCIDNDFNNPVAWLDAAIRLRSEGFTSVLCNTTVSAKAIEPLKQAGMRVVLLVHELPTLLREYKLLEAARIAAQKANAIVFPSTYVRDRFLELSGPVTDSCFVQPQGVYILPSNTEEQSQKRLTMRKLLNATPEDRIILGVGYGDLRKGIDLWVDLIQLVTNKFPNSLFVWVGRIDKTLLTQIQEELANLGLSDRLRLPGETNTLQDMYAVADIFALTSREDPFPNVVLEAMAHGLPVVAFQDATGIYDQINKTGATLVPYLDVAAMAKIICNLLQNSNVYQSISAMGQQIIEQEFDFNNYVSYLLHLASNKRLTVSVIVPNYNYAHYLHQRLESICSQTYPIHEIILLDDASTDDSKTVIAELMRKCGDRLKVVYNQENSGSVSSQWAHGVKLATGDLIWIAEADDFAEPSFLETTIKAFANPQTVLSYSQSRQIDEMGKILAENYLDYVSDVDPHLWQNNYHRLGSVEIAEALSVKNTIPNVSAILFRRDVLTRVLNTHLEEMTALHNAGDWLCYMRVLEKGSVAFTAEALNNHRRHSQSITLAATNQQHWSEIEAMQGLAASLVSVSQKHQLAAQKYLEAVAIYFGLTTETLTFSPPPPSELEISCHE